MESTRWPSRLSSSEVGLATVWAAWWVLSLMIVGLVVAVGAAVAARQHHVDGAADLVAVSSARQVGADGDPCAIAATVARANRVQLAVCRVEGFDIVVTVTDHVSLPFGLDATLSGHARAGPSAVAGG